MPTPLKLMMATAGVSSAGYYLFSVGKHNAIGAASLSSPVIVGDEKKWTDVGSGSFTTAAITSAGNLYTWGPNTGGSLGDGTVVDRTSPVLIGALTNWLYMGQSSGSSVVKSDASIWSFGYNVKGQRGDETTISRSSPVQVGSDLHWTQVSQYDGDQGFQLGIRTNGTLWSWGNNNNGALGIGTTTPEQMSSPLQIGSLTTWASVSTGNNRGWAIKTDGTLWSWGKGSQGNLGHGNVINYSSPTQIGSLTTWSKVSGEYWSCLAIKTDGTLWAWGNSDEGTLGQGDVVDTSSPVQVGSGTDWSSVSQHQGVWAIKTDGTLWAWGSNGDGQLGLGDRIKRSSPVQVGSDTDWIKVATGNGRAVALKGTP